MVHFGEIPGNKLQLFMLLQSHSIETACIMTDSLLCPTMRLRVPFPFPSLHLGVEFGTVLVLFWGFAYVNVRLGIRGTARPREKKALTQKVDDLRRRNETLEGRIVELTMTARREDWNLWERDTPLPPIPPIPHPPNPDPITP